MRPKLDYYITSRNCLFTFLSAGMDGVVLSDSRLFASPAVHTKPSCDDEDESRMRMSCIETLKHLFEMRQIESNMLLRPKISSDSIKNEKMFVRECRKLRPQSHLISYKKLMEKV
ncbi:CLUMA_CG018514, isoform A [Clunio marinus]|uniref:CLUMA_CG018514, isoform A n=1 Tax=Clunio marinus TaxID=568069 RepID=A0A1J1J0E6_9DIPT|nr:CLUMA_CG018514, isoform A [Clunio marinus]